MARPLIGISTYRQEAQWGAGQRPAALLPVGHIAVGWDAEDRSVEALQLVDRDFVVAIQWHPEEDGGDLRLFAGLIAAATAARGATRESVR